jgi:hypothetical protein
MARISVKREIGIAIAFSATFATAAFGLTVAIMRFLAH